MVAMTVSVLVDLGLRWFRYHGPTSALLGLSLAAAVIAAMGATYGGTLLVFGYGFNVETAGDHPVWHRSKVDVFSGQPHPVSAVSAVGPDTGNDGTPK
jgi:hypothetical protein